MIRYREKRSGSFTEHKGKRSGSFWNNHAYRDHRPDEAFSTRDYA
jgi:hypothetical protein